MDCKSGWQDDFAGAAWIWQPGEPNPSNYYLAARRSFTLDDVPTQATLHISADARYVLYVNGRYVGRGPNRGWPFAQQYDSHDVARFLRTGANTIAVLVHNIGVSTYQYMPGRGGLICRLETDGETALVSDGAWRVTRHTGWQRPTPRAALQMGWAEQYDARAELTGWTDPDFDDSAWERAEEIGPAGVEPWTGMTAREIPFLTEDPVYPARVMRVRTVRPPQHVLDVNLRPYLPPGHVARDVVALLALVIDAPEACRARLLPYGRLGLRAAALNGETLNVIDRMQPIDLDLPAGQSLLVIDTGTTRTYGTISFALDADVELDLSCPVAEGETPVAVSAFDPEQTRDAQELIAAALSAPDAEALSAGRPEFTCAAPAHVCTAHNGLDTQYAREVEGAAPSVEDIQAICAANAEVTTIHPNAEGDTELLIDFGAEVSGLLEFEVEAAAGTVLDFYGFEAFAGDQPQWTRIDAGLRYITRAGVQRFVGFHRRGLRYLLLTVRGATAPVRFRELLVRFHSMPVPARGGFRCSDALLNRIWQMCAHTTRCCMEDTFVDCPLYEQALWVGDARNEALIAHYLFGSYEFTKRCWRLTAGSLFRSPVPESRVPSGDEGILTAWAELWVLACQEQYLYDGDLDFQREVYPSVATTLRNFLGMRNRDGLLAIAAWNMVDWAPMDTPHAGVVTHNCAWLVEALRRGARMADLLGETEDAEEFRRGAAEMVAAINTHLWDDERGAYIDSIHADGTRSPVFSQQTQTVCYLCGAVPRERLATVKRHVFEPPDDFVRIGSPFFMFFSFEALMKLGLDQLVLDWTREYWGEMLRRDATTAWEMFGTTRSHCHAWSAGPAYFLQRYQLGVEPAEPGFARARIAPVPLDLDWCEGRVPTPHGEIEVAWQREGKRFRMQVKLPAEVCADVILPCPTDYFPPPRVSGEGAEEPRRAAGMWKLRLAPGAQVRIEGRRR